MTRYCVALVAVLAAAGLGLAGCNGHNHHDRQNPSPSQQISQGARTMGHGLVAAGHEAGQYASDSAITSKVKAELAGKQGLSSVHIHVTTDHGVVTLEGTVDNASQRDMAGRIAKNTKGVKSVDNKIRVAQ